MEERERGKEETIGKEREERKDPSRGRQQKEEKERKETAVGVRDGELLSGG